MEKEMKKLSLLEKINKAREEMSLAKDQKNNYGNYNYRNIEQIWERLVPVCSKNRLAYGITKEAAKTENGILIIHYEATFYDLDSGETLTTELDIPMTEFAKKGMDSNQVFGSLLSYSRKYIVCRDFQIRAGLAELDSDDEIQSILTAIEQCKTQKEVVALRPQIDRIAEQANKDKVSKAANEKYMSLKKEVKNG